MSRICVFGAGGVGGYLAATLARAGRDVSIVARGAHLRAICQDGLHITSGQDTFSVRLPASDDFGALGPQDVIVVTAKTTALAEAARAIGPHLSADAIVIFAVNGLFWFYADGFAPSGRAISVDLLDPDGALHREIGVHRACGMIVRSQNEVVEPGHVLNNGGGEYLLGAALADGRRLDQIGALLTAPGAQTRATDDIRREMWRKLIRNTTIALVCIPTQATAGAAYRDPQVSELVRTLMHEVDSIAAAHGFANVLNLSEDAQIVSCMNAMKPSIVQDLERGRPMEIDSQILAVQDLARQTEVATPMIDTLAPLVLLKARLAGAYPPAVETRKE